MDGAKLVTRLCSVGLLIVVATRPVVAQTQASQDSEPSSAEKMGRLVVQLEKSQPLFHDGRTKPARGVILRIDGRSAGTTNERGLWSAHLPPGHYLVGSSGLRNRSSRRVVEISDGREERVELHHRRRILQAIFVEWPWLLVNRRSGHLPPYPGISEGVLSPQ